jgi:hypothetical protein
MTVPWAPSTPSGGRAYSDSNQDHAVLDFLLVSLGFRPLPPAYKMRFFIVSAAHTTVSDSSRQREEEKD